MARWWHHSLIAAATLAVAVPVRVQLDLGDGSVLPIVGGTALAKGAGGGGHGGGPGGNGNGGGRGNGGNGNAGGNGNSGGNGNGNGGGGNGGGRGGAGNHGNNGNNGNGAGQGGGNGGGKGNSSAGAPGAGRGGGPGAGPAGSHAGGNGSKASASSGSNRGRSNAGAAPAADSARGKGKAQATIDAPVMRGATPAASPQRAAAQAKAPARAPTARIGTSVQTRAARAVPAAEETDRRPKPRRSTRFIVASGLSQDDLAKLTARGFRVEARTPGRIAPEVVRLRVPGGVSVAQARRQVRLVDARASVDFDQYYYLDEAPPACTGAACQASSPVNWASLVAWSDAQIDQCGLPPLIGLIDTGVNRDHAALKGQAIEVLPLPERRSVASLQDHGTAIAALLVGRPASPTPGLLPQAKVVAVDAFYRDGGTADRTDVTMLVAAIEALSERGARVLNMSLSGPANEVLQAAIAAAQAKGIVIVAAAGNNGAGAEPAYPAAYPGVVAVTAVDHELNAYRRATRGAYVALSAPGVNVWTAAAQSNGLLRTGTSYAVPFVSAAASLVLASSPALDARAVKARLEESARDLGEPGRDQTFGFGLVQMAGLCAQPAEPPAVATIHEAPGPSSARPQALAEP